MAAPATMLKLLLVCMMLVCGVCINGNSQARFGLSNPAHKGATSSTQEKDREQLYEAYNLLHSLAQDFHKPFDAPAVIVVGHQTSGKSALIEALMGFQFNQVGGGTKTRRPIALRMQYNANYATPVCFLTIDGKEEQKSLPEIQAYIEGENKRLERDPTRSFDPREINIRMEYKYCPNMIVIDTPGMLHPPKGKQLTAQQRALAQAAREAEDLVLSKIKCEDYIILCVEDTTDWKHATTRNIVMQADPQLTRTVLVTTKLDTKLPQFSESEDLQDFLQAPLVHTLFSQLMGGPFFTSVPSGRVGLSKDYDTNEAFVTALRAAEQNDRAVTVSKMGPVKARPALQNVGVSRLRSFLEARVEDCYRRNVAKIVPLLQSELRAAEAKLADVDTELRSLSLEHLRQTANEYREKFAKELSSAIQGSVKASPMEWGETLEAEAAKSGSSFLTQSEVRSEAWQRILDDEVGNNNQRLYGGAQYHRSMREFTVAVRHMASAVVTEDEIANAAGMGDRHNGVNFMRAACVIAMEKAQISFEPMLESLRARSSHIMKRLFPVVEEMIRKSALSGGSGAGLGVHSAPFQQMIRSIYEKFVEERVEAAVQRCREDLFGMTRYVTFDQEDKGGASTLYRLLPTPQRMAKMVEVLILTKDKQKKGRSRGGVTGDGMVDDLDDLDEADAEDGEEEEGRGRYSASGARGREGRNNKHASRLPGVTMGWRLGRKKPLPAPSPSAVDKVLSDWKRATTKAEKKQRVAAGSSDSGWEKPGRGGSPRAADGRTGTGGNGYAVAHVPSQKTIEEDAELNDHYRIMQLTEEMISGTSASRTSALVTALVQFIISSWRNHFARAATMKFNCFFLLPFMDEFPAYLRNELDNMYNQGIGELYDLAETRRALQARRSELLAECTANSRLQQRFDEIATQISANAGANGAGVTGGSAGGNRASLRTGAPVSTEPTRFPDVTFADVQSRLQGNSQSEGNSEDYSRSSTSEVDGGEDRN